MVQVVIGWLYVNPPFVAGIPARLQGLIVVPGFMVHGVQASDIY